MEYPLATVNHMMHLVHPDTIDYIVQEGGNDGHDQGLIRWAYWGRDENTITEALDTWSESVMVFVQPPWILTQADMEAFVGCPTVGHLFFAIIPHHSLDETVSSTNLTKENEELREAVGKGGLHRLLCLLHRVLTRAQIWDLCTQKRSHWFVLTTYWGWVFGAFSPGKFPDVLCLMHSLTLCQDVRARSHPRSSRSTLKSLLSCNACSSGSPPPSPRSYPNKAHGPSQRSVANTQTMAFNTPAHSVQYAGRGSGWTSAPSCSRSR